VSPAANQFRRAPAFMTPRLLLRLVLTHLLGLAAAWLFVQLHTPIPWMMGPLLVTGAASVMGAPVASAVRVRNLAQWTIGGALGLYFTPEITGLVVSLWWAVLLSVVWAVALGWAFGWWLHARHAPLLGGTPRQQWATAFFSGAIGGSNEMAILAEREGGRADLVAAAHTVRLLLITLIVPFAFTFSGLHTVPVQPPGPRDVHWGGLALLALASGLSIALMSRFGKANSWFIGALAATTALTVAGIHLSAVPVWMTNAAQLVIGVGLGVRFSPGFLRAAPRWIAVITVGSVGLVVSSAAFGALLAWGTGQHTGTMILGTAPGGIAEMAITAKSMQLGVAVVTALQVCRVLSVLLLIEPMFHRLYGRPDPGVPGPGQ